MPRSRQRKKTKKPKPKHPTTTPIADELKSIIKIEGKKAVGYYTEYLDKQINANFDALHAERKRQLKRISEIRGGRDVLVIAADLNKANAPTSIDYGDLLPINDQISNLKGAALDLILETPGGLAEVAEDIVNSLRNKYSDIGVIVPGWAKSAGTILAMSADEILMEPASALGPIDAQLFWQGKVFSADALLEGFEKIKKEVESADTLNKAYIPILQGISPGEIQSAENALKFAQILVTSWLAKYKFKNWTEHSSTKQPVTEEEKQQRAQEIAKQLCDHRRWLTHGRSIKLSDLKTMRVLVTDYSTMPDLAEAIRRYHTLMQITFASNIYKLFETPDSQIFRFITQQVPPPAPASPSNAIIDVECGNCHTTSRVQASFEPNQPLQQGCIPFPANNKLRCPNCKVEHDLSDARRQIEAQTKKRIIT